MSGPPSKRPKPKGPPLKDVLETEIVIPGLHQKIRRQKPEGPPLREISEGHVIEERSSESVDLEDV